MLRLKKDDLTNSYFISSANWELTVISTSFDKAVSLGLEEMFKEYGKTLSLSPAIIVVDMTNFCINFSEDHAKVYSTSMVLSDIGMHDLSKKFKKIVPNS
jgi:hypothetical protein